MVKHITGTCYYYKKFRHEWTDCGYKRKNDMKGQWKKDGKVDNSTRKTETIKCCVYREPHPKNEYPKYRRRKQMRMN